jgi:hypothetical protein
MRITILAFYCIIAGLTLIICIVSLVELKLQVSEGFKFVDTLEHLKPLGFTIGLC